MHATRFLLLAAVLTVHAQPTAAGKTLGSIEGKLIDAQTGEPVRKGTLSLIRIRETEVLTPGSVPLNQSTTSDADAKFSFSDLPAGRYILTAEKSGYISQQYGSRTGPGTPGVNITLNDGQKLTQLEFRLTRQAVITGRVLDEDGEPVPRASVSVLRRILFARWPSGVQNTQTNDIGEFRIANLAAGQYFITVDPRSSAAANRPIAAGEGSLKYVTTLYPNGADPASASPLNVSAGQQLSGVDITLRKARTYRVSGKVLGLPSGLTSARIALQPQMQSAGGYPSFGGSALVNADGTFMIPAASPGTYDATILANGPSVLVTAGQTSVTVPNRDIDNVTIHAHAPLDLKGRVVIEGETTDKLAGQVSAAFLQPGIYGVDPSLIEEDGAFQLTGVPRTRLSFRLIGLPAGMYVNRITAGDADITTSGLDLSAADSAPPVVIAVRPNGSRLEGTAVDADGKPFPGALITLVPQGIDLNEPAAKLRHRAASTDGNGRYALKGIAPGEYRLYAWEHALVNISNADAEKLKPFEKHALGVTIKEASVRQVELKVIPIPTN